MPSRISPPATTPVIAMTRNDAEKPQAEFAPSTISGASAPPMWPSPSVSATPVARALVAKCSAV